MTIPASIAEYIASLRAKCYDSEPSYREVVDALCGLRNIPVPPRPPLGKPGEPLDSPIPGEFSFLPLSSVAGRAPGCGEEGER